MVARRNSPANRTHSEGDGRKTGSRTAAAMGATRSFWMPIAEYFVNNPAAFVAVAFTGGMILGWLVKRK